MTARETPGGGFVTPALAWLMGGVATLGVLGGGLALFTALTARRVEKALPPQGRFLDLDGDRIHYLDEGSGPAILMIHGLGGQMRNFTYALVERLKGEFRVVVMERPGSGYSTRPSDAFAGLRHQAGVVACFIQALGLERPLLVGHSLGGAVSLAVALDHPQAVGALALVAPLTHPQDSLPAPFRGLFIPSRAVRRAVAWTLATPLGILRRDAMLEMLFGPEAAPADFAMRGGGALGLRPASFYAASTDMMAVDEDLPGLVARYGELRLPVGILFGSGDRVLDWRSEGYAMQAKVAGLDYEEIEGGGHMIPLTQPDRTAAFVARMARRVSRLEGERA